MPQAGESHELYGNYYPKSVYFLNLIHACRSSSLSVSRPVTYLASMRVTLDMRPPDILQQIKVRLCILELVCCGRW